MKTVFNAHVVNMRRRKTADLFPCRPSSSHDHPPQRNFILQPSSYPTLTALFLQMMALGDFIAELREDYDLRTAVVDEVLEHMTTHGWVQLWKRKGTEETWISVTED